MLIWLSLFLIISLESSSNICTFSGSTTLMMLSRSRAVSLGGVSSGALAPTYRSVDGGSFLADKSVSKRRGDITSSLARECVWLAMKLCTSTLYVSCEPLDLCVADGCTSCPSGPLTAAGFLLLINLITFLDCLTSTRSTFCRYP